MAGTTKMTQCLSSHDPTEKSSISHSYISMSSSEDAGVGHSGNLHWASELALALRPGAKGICGGCASSHEGLHVPQPRVLCTSDEPNLLSTSVVQWYHLGWHSPILPTIEVPHWWRVRLGYPFDANCFLGFRSFRAILSELSCGVWPIQAFSSFSDSPNFRFIFFFCSFSSRATPDSRLWVHSYPHHAPSTWACSRRRMWWCYSRWFQEWFPLTRWVMRWLHAEPSTRITPFWL